MNRFESTIENANRALYGTARRRTFFFKGLTALLAFQMAFLGATPALAASALSGLMENPANVNDDGTLKAGAYRGLPGGDTPFMDGNDHVTITGSGTALFQTSDSWAVTGGDLTYSGGWIYLLANGGLTFSGGTINAAGLVAAAMNDFSFGKRYSPDDVGGNVSISGGSLPSSKVFIGKTVTGGDGATVVSTDGLSPLSPTKNNGKVLFSVSDNGGTITFVNAKISNGSSQASTITFLDEIGENANEGSTGTALASKESALGQVSDSGSGTAYGRLNDAQATLASSQAQLQTLTDIRDQAQATYDATPTPENLAALQTAQQNVNDQQTLVTAAEANVSTAEANVNTAEANVSTAVTALNAAQGEYANALEATETANQAALASATKGNGEIAGGTVLANTVNGATVTISGGNTTLATFDANVVQTAGAINSASTGLEIKGTLNNTGTGTIDAKGALTLGTSAAADAVTTLRDAGLAATTTKIIQKNGTINISDNSLGFDFQQVGGTINATTFEGNVVQTAGAINSSATGLEIKKTLDNTGTGTIDAKGALTLGASAADNDTTTLRDAGLAATTTKIIQKNGKINVSDGSLGLEFQQDGGTANSATFEKAVEQNAGIIKGQSGSLTFNEVVTKNVGTIGAAGQNITFNGDVTQSESGKIVGDTVTAMGNIAQTAESGIEAGELNLRKASHEYKLTGGANNVAVLYGMTTAKSIEIDNGTHALAIGKTAGGNKYGISTTHGLTIKSAGAVTDDGSSVVDGTIKIDSSASVTLDDATALSIAGVTSSGKVSIDTGTSTLEPTSLKLFGDISSAGGDIGIKTQSFTQNGKTISGNNVTLLGTGANGITVGGNVTATAGDILVKSAGGDVTTGAQTLDATSGSVVLQGQNVTVSGTTINAKTTGEGVGIEALDNTDTTDPTKGTVTINGNATITAEKVVLVAPGDLTVASGVAMGKTAAANKDADLTVLTDNALKMGLDAGSRPTKNVRIAGAKSMDADLNQEITLAQFAINAESLPELKFSEATERISIESTGDVKLTTKSDVTIFNNVADGASASVEAKNVVDSADVKVQAGVPEDKAAHGLVGKTINMTAGGAVTVEDGAIVSVSQGDLVLATPNNKNFTIQNGALVNSKAGNVTLTSGGAMVADGRIVSGTVTVGENQTVMNGTATTVGAVTLEAAGDVDVGKTGKVEGKNDVTLTSSTGDINFLGKADSTDGDVVMSATADGKSVKIGDAGSTVGPISPAVAAVVSAGNNVSLTGGRGVLALGGSEITAANAVSATAKEFIATDADIEGAGKVTLTTSDAQTLTAAAGGYQAGDPAGVLVQGGSIQSTGDAVEMTAAGSVIVANGVTVAAKTTLDITANGESSGTTEQGVKLAGTVSAEGKGTIKAEKGSIEQTGGSLATKALDLKAKDIKQTGGRVMATGAATAEATDGSVILAQENNDFDFQNGLDVTAKNGVNVRDANDLSVSVAGDTTGDVRLQAGTALDVTSDIDAGGAATLLSGGHMNAQAVKAATAVQATATAGGATFTGDVEAGTTATLEATGAALETQAVTANGGNASLTGASVTTAGNVTANGANADANINATAGAAQIGGAVTVGRDANINATGGAAQTGGAVTAGRDADINATAGANTAADAVTAGRDATIAAGGGAAQVAAVTATAGNAMISGASVNNTGNVQAGGNAALVGGAGGTTVGGNVTAGGNAVVISDGGAATVNANATVQAANIGVQGATIANNGTYAANGQLALVQTGGQAVTLDDASLPAGAQTVGIRTAGDLTVESEHALTFGNASVTAGGRTVQADGLASTDGAVDVTAGGNITSSAITGANGTTVTTENGGAINVAGNLGQGGDTVVNANGADVTAGALASGGLLDVNNAGAVAANIAAGGEAQIQAGSLVAGNTAAGGNLTLEVGGAADVGQLAVGGDMNGVVGGQFQTTGGQVGSIGQGGAFQANGGFLQNGVLGSGAVNVQAANYQLNGNLNAGGAAVNIIAGGGIQGNGVLTGGALTLVGGAIGAAANPLQVVSANLQQITGNGVWLVDTAAGTIAINVINSTGNVGLNIPNAQVAGGGSITAGGDIDLTVNQRFGTLANPVTVSFGGTLTIDGAGVPLLHIVIDGTANPSDLDIIYNANGFAIWGNPQDGYQIVGLGPDKQRLINRALAFTVNTPELKSKQGVFGDPGMIHTKMSVSEARSLANMDMLSLSAVNFRKTWEGIRSKEGAAALRKWTPRGYQNNTPLRQKLEAVASEMETQPEIWVPGQAASERTDDRQ